LQKVVVLLLKLITQVGLILTGKAEHLFDAFGINQKSKDLVHEEPLMLNALLHKIKEK